MEGVANQRETAITNGRMQREKSQQAVRKKSMVTVELPLVLVVTSGREGVMALCIRTGLHLVG